MRVSSIILSVAVAAVATVLSVSCCGGSKSSESDCDCDCCRKTAADTVNSVLVVVDVQRDFFSPDGSLYVGGSEELPVKIAAIAADYDAVVFTLDWHPANHCSFKEQGGIWPSHCVAYTQGAGLADEFAPVIAAKGEMVNYFLKGTDPSAEEYGAFDSIAECRIVNWFKTAEKVAVCGIAGDYCVKESTANILKVIPAEKVVLLNDCIRSIDGGAALAAFAAENNLKME